jgi:hypothetical protein
MMMLIKERKIRGNKSQKKRKIESSLSIFRDYQISKKWHSLVKLFVIFVLVVMIVDQMSKEIISIIQPLVMFAPVALVQHQIKSTPKKAAHGPTFFCRILYTSKRSIDVKEVNK